jgi:hypothetical protein
MEQQRGSTAAEAARSAGATCEWPGCQRTATERLGERLDCELGDDWSGAGSPRFCEHHAELVARDALRCMAVQRAFFRSDRF